MALQALPALKGLSSPGCSAHHAPPPAPAQPGHVHTFSFHVATPKLHHMPHAGLQASFAPHHKKKPTTVHCPGDQQMMMMPDGSAACAFATHHNSFSHVSY
eukprot:Hpha_TRINITY_DN7993_c0_g1::TRINITY_DN7993_c0_g1_i1::g.146103::m.146103